MDILKIAKWSQLHLTADKREVKDFLQLPLSTSFIRKSLSSMTGLNFKQYPISDFNLKDESYQSCASCSSLLIYFPCGYCFKFALLKK